MSLERPASLLPGVRFGAVERLEDRRGSFRELWRASAFDPIDPADAGLADAGAPRSRPVFVQANLSTSATGVLRGLHYHRRQLDYWIVISGRALVALVDVRTVLEGRSARPTVETREVAEDDWVVIPAGVAHGFLALEPVRLMYLVTNEYDGTDEMGFAWDDPAVGVSWPPVPGSPDGRPILSDRDRSNPPLADLLVRLRDSAF